MTDSARGAIAELQHGAAADPKKSQKTFVRRTCVWHLDPMSNNSNATPRRRGRQPDASSKSGQIREMLKTGMTAGEIAKKLDCTPALVYNVKARMAGGGGKKRGRGRPPKAASSGGKSSSLDGIDGILDAVRNSERERAQLRTALQKIQSLVADALA
jgi:DNA-binding CsgD family transcriptional regulator